MKKYSTIALSIILLAFILISCSASTETATDSSTAVTTDNANESFIADTTDNTENSMVEVTDENTAAIAPAADPNAIIEVPLLGNVAEPEYNVPFDLTPYYIETEPVIDAYNFNIISQYSGDYLDGNNFVLPKLTSDKAGAVALNKKFIDNFLSKMHNLLNKLSDIDVIKQIKIASANYSYTVNDDIIIILMNTSVYSQGSDAGGTDHAVYYYDSGTDRELTFEEYLTAIGESVQSILNIINEDRVRLTYGGYHYNNDFYFTVKNLISAYKRDDGAFCVILKINNEEFIITTPYTTENNYCVYTLSGNSAVKYSSILFKQADDYSGGWHANYELPSYRNYKLLWIDSETVAVTYYTEPNLRSFAVINLNIHYLNNYICNISDEDILTANNIDPGVFSTKPELDIYPESMDVNSKLLTIKYKLIGYNLTGELYYNTETDEVYFPGNEEKPVYIKDASGLISNSGNLTLFTFPHKGISVTMKFPFEMKNLSYNVSGNYETISVNWNISINCYRNYTSVEMSPEEGCKTFFTSSNSYPGNSRKMVTENAFVSDVIRITTNGKEYSNKDEFIIAYYLAGEDDVFITLNCRGVYTLDQIKEIAKSISWCKTTD